MGHTGAVTAKSFGSSKSELPVIDPNVPNAARVYNVYLGGYANFPADVTAAHDAATAYPGGMDALRTVARTNRDFLGRSVRYLATEAGIRQFLDLGTGIPDEDNVHIVAREARADSRVVCVDYDGVVLAHAHMLMKPQTSTAFLNGDFRDHENVLGMAAETLDFDEPVAVMLIALLHLFRDEDNPHRMVAAYMDALPSGSYLAVTHLTNDLLDMAETARRLSETMTEPMVLRTQAEVASFFEGLELLEPGIVPVDQWRPDSSPQGNVVHYAAVGRKP